MILTRLLWKLHCQNLQTFHTVCVHSCHWLNWADKDQGGRRGDESEYICFFRGYSDEQNLNFSILGVVEISWTPAAAGEFNRQPSDSELSPQAFTGLFPRFKYFQDSKATRTAQTWMPPPWPPPALSQSSRHPPAHLHSKPGAFFLLPRRNSVGLLSSDTDRLICGPLFLGNA